MHHLCNASARGCIPYLIPFKPRKHGFLGYRPLGGRTLDMFRFSKGMLVATINPLHRWCRGLESSQVQARAFTASV